MGAAIFADFVLTLSGLNPSIFNSDSNQLLGSISSALSGIGSEEIRRQFQDFQHNRTIVQFQINKRFGAIETIQKIQLLLVEDMGRQYTLITPLPEFQKQFIRFQKRKGSRMIPSLVCYFVFEGAFPDFSQRVRRLLRDEFNNRVLSLELVDKNVITGP